MRNWFRSLFKTPEPVAPLAPVHSYEWARDFYFKDADTDVLQNAFDAIYTILMSRQAPR